MTPAPEPFVIVRDPEVLAAMQADGLGFGEVAFGRAAADNATLARDPYYASIVATLGRDLAATARDDRHAGVGLRHLHRLFDLRWLSSKHAWFELVGVVNRLDRHVFTPGTCGETRLVYRLAHRAVQAGQPVTSRLPMTVNVVFRQRGDGVGCRVRAQSWRRTDAVALREDGGPLGAAQLDLAQLDTVEIDVQTERWPSTIRPDLGGHAGYVLRVFVRDEGRGKMVPEPLENTPDVERLRRDPAARAALLAWLSDASTLAAIDNGVVVTPSQWLATRVESVTPRGLARLANRPWSAVLEGEALGELGLSSFTTIASPTALLHRLDTLACNGCHQSRSIAGFHLLGDEAEDGRRVDALGVGTSPHLQAELGRRRAYVTAIAEGTPADTTRVAADVESPHGGYGSHCGLGAPALAWLRCTAPMQCTRVDDDVLGVCLPAERGAGAPCEVGVVTTAVDPDRDRVRTPSRLECERGGVCDDNRVGFPAGMCVVDCSAVVDGEACGAIPQLTPFNDCLSRGRPFADCVRSSANAAGMRACDETRPCRDDYICARTGTGTNVCLPPYFLYQLRVDGHP